MNKLTPKAAFRKLAALYDRMVSAYDEAAQHVGLSCENCENNCCTSYFQHHTYIEWAYLWQGMNQLLQERKDTYLQRAEEYVARARNDLAAGNRPRIMCPLNDDGLCGMYRHRLMICRMHGVPNKLVKPNGACIQFAGCYRTQELTKDREDVFVLDRTPLYRDLAQLEMGFLGNKIRQLPRVDLTLAEMLVSGPPSLHGPAGR